MPLETLFLNGNRLKCRNDTPDPKHSRSVTGKIAAAGHLPASILNVRVCRCPCPLIFPNEIQRALRVPEPERQTRLLVELAYAGSQ